MVDSNRTNRMILSFCITFIMSIITILILFYYVWPLPEHVAIPGIIFGSFLISIKNTINTGSDRK